MLNIVICLLVSAIVNVLLTALAGVSVWISSGVALVVFFGLYLLISRHVMKKVTALMETAQRDLQAQRIEKAIKTLEAGFKYSRWQFFIKPQINAQIGMIHYMKRDFTQAFPYLQKGFVRNWMSMAMLAICYMKKQKTGQMISTFEKAVAGSKKEPMLWNLYAFCLEKVGERDKAIAVLNKGAKKNPGDEPTEANLQALKEGKRMKMKAFGDLWYQFHLEKPGAIVKKQTKALTGRRKMVRR